MNFEYDSIPSESVCEHELYVLFRSTITSKFELFDCFQIQLNFPDYFGANWDALNDMLTDLSWLEMKSVVLDHQGLPQLPENELVIYLSILKDVVDSWENNRKLNVKVVFPESEKVRIEGLI